MSPEKDCINNIILSVVLGLVLIGVASAVCIMISSCTCSINLVDSQGHACDTIDETSTNTPDISPEISLPLSP